MNENEKGKYSNVFCCYYSYLYPSCMCTFFFEKCIFVWSYKKKRLLLGLMDGWMLCVCEFVLSRPTAFFFFFIFFSYTHSVFDCLFAVLYLFSFLYVLLFFKTLTLSFVYLSLFFSSCCDEKYINT
jgi:hypothetical protein